jgi:hypothetical protein
MFTFTPGQFVVLILISVTVGIVLGRMSRRSATQTVQANPEPQPSPAPTGPVAELHELLRPLPSIIVELQRRSQRYFQGEQEPLNDVQGVVNLLMNGLTKGLYPKSDRQGEAQARHATLLLHRWLPELQRFTGIVVANERYAEDANLAAGWQGTIDHIQLNLPWTLQECEDWRARSFPEEEKPRLRTFAELKAAYAAATEAGTEPA